MRSYYGSYNVPFWVQKSEIFVRLVGIPKKYFDSPKSL